jgi:hypothetical protein
VWSLPAPLSTSVATRLTPIQSPVALRPALTSGVPLASEGDWPSLTKHDIGVWCLDLIFDGRSYYTETVGEDGPRTLTRPITRVTPSP